MKKFREDDDAEASERDLTPHDSIRSVVAWEFIDAVIVPSNQPSRRYELFRQNGAVGARWDICLIDF